MKKISDELYMYKGIEVHKLSNGGYFAEVPVNNYKLPIMIIGVTQSSFKIIFNNAVKNNGGLKEK